MMTKVLILAVIFGFSGFLLESLNQSLVEKRLAYAGDKLFWKIPFLPIYALGGLLIHFVFKSLETSPWYIAIFFAWLMANGWEYISGLFCDLIIGKKLWNYDHKKYNIRGYICLQNSFAWLIVITLYYFVFFQIVNNYLFTTASFVTINGYEHFAFNLLSYSIY